MTRLASLKYVVPCVLSIVALWAGCAGPKPAAQTAVVVQETYATPEDAVVRLVGTARKGDFDLIVPIFGPQIAGLKGDSKERTEGDLQRFAAAYDRKHALVLEADGSVTLQAGEQDWEFPAPLILENGRWRFDTDAGVKEIRARRIDRNESDAADTCIALIGAQRQFFAMSAARGESTPSYASRIRSTPGKRDGLYWDDAMGAPLSPLGPMVAKAVDAGDLKMSEGPQPYHGYMFRVLTRQGKGAPGGEKNFVDANGRLTSDFAFLAWPAEYGETGVMSFQVSSDGTVFEKDLGADTMAAAKAMTAFDPSGWEKTTMMP